VHPDAALQMFANLFWTGLLVSGPVLGLTLLDGVVVSMLQVVRQVHDASLTFIPKLVFRRSMPNGIRRVDAAQAGAVHHTVVVVHPQLVLSGERGFLPGSPAHHSVVAAGVPARLRFGAPSRGRAPSARCGAPGTAPGWPSGPARRVVQWRAEPAVEALRRSYSGRIRNKRTRDGGSRRWTCQLSSGASCLRIGEGVVKPVDASSPRLSSALAKSTWLLAAVAALVACIQPSNAEESGRKPTRERQQVAMTMFAERCKKAGEFVHRTVNDVAGIFLLKVRPDRVNYANQFELDDPYGLDLLGDGYIQSFLRGSYRAGTSGTPFPGSPSPPVGYLFVDAVDPKDGIRYRYTGSLREVERVSSIVGGGSGKKFKTTAYVLDKVPSPAMPRYGLVYEDISTREEREYWIAGSSLRVIDLVSNEVIAERIGYMVDVGQGSRAGARSPWLFALDHACPSLWTNPNHGSGPAFAASQYRAARFAERVLKPKPS
jgi:hypothetical protein